LFEQVSYGLFETVAAKAQGKGKFHFKNKLASLDSTTIDLCLSMCSWAKFRRTKGVVKLQLVRDHDGYLPCFGLIPNGKVHDVRAAHQMNFASGTIVVDDRGYNDYRLFAKWTDALSTFSTPPVANPRVRHEPLPTRRPASSSDPVPIWRAI